MAAINRALRFTRMDEEPKLRAYQVEVPERHTLAQVRLAAYNVARNSVANVIGQFAGQRAYQLAGAVARR